MRRMNATQDSLVKCDRRGRLRYAPGQRAALLEAFDASGLSGPRFAALHGVKYQTLAAWIQKRKRTGATAGLPAPADCPLIEVEGPAACSGDGVVVRVPGGTELRVTSMAAVPLAAALLRELCRRC